MRSCLLLRIVLELVLLAALDHALCRTTVVGDKTDAVPSSSFSCCCSLFALGFFHLWQLAIAARSEPVAVVCAVVNRFVGYGRQKTSAHCWQWVVLPNLGQTCSLPCRQSYFRTITSTRCCLWPVSHQSEPRRSKSRR